MLESWKLSKEEMVNYWALCKYRERMESRTHGIWWGVGRRGMGWGKSDQGTGVGRDRREESLERIRDERAASESCLYILRCQEDSPAHWPLE